MSDTAHLGGVAVEAGQDTVQAEHVAVLGRATPCWGLAR